MDAAEVSASLQNGAMLLAATPQLAVDWKQRIVAERNRNVTDTPDVQSWSAWITALADAHEQMPVPLNSIQEKWLWQQVISHDLSTQTAAAVRGMARHASEAYALMQEYRIDPDELTGVGEESEALLRWIRAVEHHLQKGDLAGRILAADVSRKLIDSLDKRVVKDVQTIVLAGFDRLTPAQAELLSRLQETGVALFCESASSLCSGGLSVTGDAGHAPAKSLPEAGGANLSLCACSDEATQCQHIALQVKALLEGDDNARIGILTSDAVNDFSELSRTLNGTLVDEYRRDPGAMVQAVAMPG